jgi:hypothetical protein
MQQLMPGASSGSARLRCRRRNAASPSDQPSRRNPGKLRRICGQNSALERSGCWLQVTRQKEP